MKFRSGIYFITEIEAAMAYDEYVFKNNIPRPLNFPENYIENPNT